MPKTNEDVKTAAVTEIGADFSFFGFEDDAAFQTYADSVVDAVVGELDARITPYWSLDTEPMFRAAVYEVDARFSRRVVGRFLLSQLEGESITIGPIKIEATKNLDKLSPQVQDLFLYYHRLAEDLLAPWTGGKRGGIRNWIPRKRIGIV